MRKLFNENEIQDIKEAIRRAELGSNGEIVPIFARSSGNYHAAKYIFTIFLTFIAAAITVKFSNSDSLLLLILASSFILGINIAGQFPILCVPFITKSEMLEEVNRRACEYFYSYNLGSTHKGSALLIYTSCFEHITIVRTDLRSKDLVSHDELQEVCNLITQGMKNKKPAEGLISAIKKHGELLKRYFPNDSLINNNELTNRIHFIN